MMIRTRVALIAALMVAAVPIARAEPAPPEKAPTVSVNTDTIQPPVAMATVLALNSFEGLTMRFTPKGAVAEHADSWRWSDRTRNALQRSAFDQAFRDTLHARNFASDTFAGCMLDELVAFAGPDNVIEAVKSFKPKPDQYRVLLRAIRDRTPASDQAGRNRSS